MMAGQSRPYERGRTEMSLRVRYETVARLEREAEKRRLTPSGLAGLILEIMSAETKSDLFAAVIDDGK